MKKYFSDKILIAIFYLFAGLFAIACIYPFLLILMSSLTDEVSLIQEGYTLFPTKLSLNAYLAILSSSVIPQAYLVTLFITVFGTFLCLLVTSMAAYALSGGRLFYRNYVNFYFYFTTLFSGGLVSFYILITKYLHLQNTIWVYIIPFMFSPFNMFLMRNFFNEIPDGLFEAAKLEGAKERTILFRIVLPLSLPAIATIGLFYALGFWNSWQPALLFIENEKLFTLQYIIQQIIRNIDMAQGIATQGGAAINTSHGVAPAYTVRLATAVVTIGPIILLYPYLQRYFVSGLKVGGIKG